MVRSDIRACSNSAMAPRICKKHPPDRGEGVDALIRHHEVHPVLLQLLRQLDQVPQGAAEPVKFGDDDLVALAGEQERLVQLGPADELPARLVGEDLFAAGLAGGRPPGLLDADRAC